MTGEPWTLCIRETCARPKLPDQAYCAEHWAQINDGGRREGSRIVCPFCRVAGHVRRERRRVKRGIHGGKATGAVLTAGLSTLVTGLSRKEWETELRCGNCGTVWNA